MQQILAERLCEPDGFLIECLPNVCAIHVNTERGAWVTSSFRRLQYIFSANNVLGAL